jgi:quercetin dioxygenase-like cupin family protein
MKSLIAAIILLPLPALAQDVMSYHVRHLTLLAEDAHTRVLRYSPHKGDKTPMHSHPNSVVYVVRGGRVKLTLPDGSATISTYKTGQVLLRPPITHADEALDEVEMILTELKPQAVGK